MCDLERVDILLVFYGPTAAALFQYVGDLCFAFLALPVRSEVLVADSHNSHAAVALKILLVHVKDAFVQNPPLSVQKCLSVLPRIPYTGCGPLTGELS